MLSLVNSKTKVLQATATISNVAVVADHLQITCVSHFFEIGDLVSIEGVIGAVESNSPGIVASVSSNVFTLEQLTGGITGYTSGGRARHLG